MTMYDLRSALQDDPWQAMNEALGKKTWRLRGPGWSALCVQEKRRVGSYLYVPYGPVCASRAALTEAVRAIAALARTQRAWWVRVEPRPPVLSPHDDLTSWRETMVRASFHRAAHDHQPAHTRLIDVSRPGEDILADATGSIRTIHRNHHKKGLAVRRSTHPDDVTILTSFLTRTTQEQGIRPRSHAYLMAAAQTLMPRGAATLYTTWNNDEPLCATLVYDSPTQRLFAHSAMPREHRQLRPNQPLITTALLDAHDRGTRTADLFGIAPPDQPEHPWNGFTQFKRSFGGHDITHLGTWEHALVPAVTAVQERRTRTARKKP